MKRIIVTIPRDANINTMVLKLKREGISGWRRVGRAGEQLEMDIQEPSNVQSLLNRLGIHWIRYEVIETQEKTNKKEEKIIDYGRVKHKGMLYFFKPEVLEHIKGRLHHQQRMQCSAEHIFNIDEMVLLKYRNHDEGSEGWIHMENMLRAEFNTFELITTLEKI